MLQNAIIARQVAVNELTELENIETVQISVSETDFRLSELYDVDQQSEVISKIALLVRQYD